jgi:hypothetical protein
VLGKSRWHRFGLALLLGLGIAVFCVGRATAATTVLLQYRDMRLSVPLTALQSFAEQGEPSAELQAFFQETQEDPEQVHQWLTTDISPGLGALLPEEFVLYQINKTLGDPLGREDFPSLKTALAQAYANDQAFSVLEVLEQYPQSEVRLTLSSLERVYTDIHLIVTRIQPVLAVAKQLLPELVCNCTITTERTTDTDLNRGRDSSQAETLAVQSLSNPKSPIQNPKWDELPARMPRPEALPDAEQSAVRLASLSSPVSTATGLKTTRQTVAYTQAQKAMQSLYTLEPETTAQTAQSLVAVANPASAYADKNLIFAFGPIRPSISVGELTEFVETGKLSRGWRFYLNLANIDREDLQQALSQEVTVDGLFLDQKLNSLLGEFLLFEVGQIIQPPSGAAKIQALRSTLVLSALRDNHFSVLELLQNYPTREIQVNGLRLARLGRTASRLRAQGLIGIASSVEDWLVQVQSSAAESVCDCQQDLTATAPLIDAPIPVIAMPTVSQFLPANWQPVASHREDSGIIKVVWLTGTPYEMGFQHGQLLHDEIASIGQKVINVARFAARGFALGRLASKRTYPDLIEECRGLVDATKDLGIDMDVCLVMAYADVYQEILGYTLPNELFWEGCNQMVAAGSATLDGRLYHGSSVDNGTPVPFVMNHPVIFVRQPNTGLPHIFVAYPGVIWPNSGMNVAGITLGLDTAHPNSPDELSLAGRSNVQIMAKILQTATSFEEARTLMETQPRVRANLIMIADGKSKQAGVFEFTGKNIGVRTMPDSGVLYVTNHFELADMYEKQALPPEPSSLSRFDRFKQLLEPDQASSYYGRITPEVVARIERDRVNPYTQEASRLDLFDDNASPGGNGSLRQAIYDPDRLRVWIAAGQAPVPENPFVCFAVGEMLGFPNAAPCESPEM